MLRVEYVMLTKRKEAEVGVGAKTCQAVASLHVRAAGNAIVVITVEWSTTILYAGHLLWTARSKSWIGTMTRSLEELKC